MATPTFSYAVDDERHLISMSLTGREDSAHYADQIIAVYREVPEVWRYNRLVDHRRFRGMITFDDLRRMSEVWADVTAGHGRVPKVAFLTRSALTQSRIVAHNEVFAQQHRRAFTNLAEALDWVVEDETVA